MLARLGNVIYWFALFGLIGCIGFGVYEHFSPVSQEAYQQYASLMGSNADSWETYQKREIEHRQSDELLLAAVGFFFIITGKAMQYILGGTWKLRDLRNNC